MKAIYKGYNINRIIYILFIFIVVYMYLLFKINKTEINLNNILFMNRATPALLGLLFSLILNEINKISFLEINKNYLKTRRGKISFKDVTSIINFKGNKLSFTKIMTKEYFILVPKLIKEYLIAEGAGKKNYKYYHKYDKAYNNLLNRIRDLVINENKWKDTKIRWEVFLNIFFIFHVIISLFCLLYILPDYKMGNIQLSPLVAPFYKIQVKLLYMMLAIIPFYIFSIYNPGIIILPPKTNLKKITIGFVILSILMTIVDIICLKITFWVSS